MLHLVMGGRNGREFGSRGPNWLIFPRMSPWRGAVVLMPVVAMLAVAPPARADIYRCTDRSGTTHYTTSRTKGMRCEVAVRGRKKPSKKARPSRARASRPSHGSPRGSTPAPARRSDRVRQFDRYVVEAARLYRLPAAFIRAVVRVESDFNPQVVSHAGAMGLMQLMPRTAAAMGVRNPFDPRQNIFGGSRYLRILANKFNGDLVLTVAAYNAGEGAVVRYRGVPPYAETRRYVRRVLKHYYAYRQHGG